MLVRISQNTKYNKLIIIHEKKQRYTTKTFTDITAVACNKKINVYFEKIKKGMSAPDIILISLWCCSVLYLTIWLSRFSEATQQAETGNRDNVIKSHFLPDIEVTKWKFTQQWVPGKWCRCAARSQEKAHECHGIAQGVNTLVSNNTLINNTQ